MCRFGNRYRGGTNVIYIYKKKQAPTFPKVHSLEHVSLGDPVALSGGEELGDLLHLFEGHARALDLLYRFVSCIQTVDKLAQNLWRGHGETDGKRKKRYLKGGNAYSVSERTIRLMCDTYASVFKPSLESLFPRLGLPDTGPTLTADPLHQDLLQVRVVLAVNLILNLPAQAVGWTFVSHADSLKGGQEAEEAAWTDREE